MMQKALITLCVLLAGALVWRGLIVKADTPTTGPASAPMSTPTTAPIAERAAASNERAAQSNERGSRGNRRSWGRNNGNASPASSAVDDRSAGMPREYAVLITRSMFVRGHVAEAGHAPGHNSNPSNSASTEPSLQRAETGLVFNGVTQTASTIDALVEDTESGRVLTVHSGDAVAKGTVGKITLDSLEYLSGGKTVTVQMGQNFTGGDTDLSQAPTTGPAMGGSGASPEDILERLRQKRRQEMGGK